MTICSRRRGTGAPACGAVLLALLAGCAGDGLDVYLPPPPWVWGCTPPAETPPKLSVRGTNLIGFSSSEYVGSAARVDRSLASFAAVGGNWVAVNFWWFQDDPLATEIGPDPARYTISDEAIAAAVAAAHTHGLQVVLRPMVDLRDGTSRWFIQPSARWFGSYQDFVTTYARRAAEWQVEAFSVGAEFALTEPCESEWRRVVAAVRSTYDGTLVYCATYDTAATLPWWDAVDVIGVDAYYTVAVCPDTDSRAMTCAWSYWLDRVERSVVARYPNKPVWLAEVGVRAARGAARLPWCYNDPCFGLVDGQQFDGQEQADYYRAVLLAAGERSWLTGIFWWAWNADPDGPSVGPTDYTPQGNPAEGVLAEFWAGQG